MMAASEVLSTLARTMPGLSSMATECRCCFPPIGRRRPI